MSGSKEDVYNRFGLFNILRLCYRDKRTEAKGILRMATWQSLVSRGVPTRKLGISAGKLLLSVTLNVRTFNSDIPATTWAWPSKMQEVSRDLPRVQMVRWHIGSSPRTSQSTEPQYLYFY